MAQGLARRAVYWIADKLASLIFEDEVSGWKPVVVKFIFGGSALTSFVVMLRHDPHTAIAGCVFLVASSLWVVTIVRAIQRAREGLPSAATSPPGPHVAPSATTPTKVEVRTLLRGDVQCSGIGIIRPPTIRYDSAKSVLICQCDVDFLGLNAEPRLSPAKLRLTDTAGQLIALLETQSPHRSDFASYGGEGSPASINDELTRTMGGPSGVAWGFYKVQFQYLTVDIRLPMQPELGQHDLSGIRLGSELVHGEKIHRFLIRLGRDPHLTPPFKPADDEERSSKEAQAEFEAFIKAVDEAPR